MCLKTVKTSWYAGVFSHSPWLVIHKKINLTMWDLTSFKGFRIGAHMQEITSAWKVTLGMKRPVYPFLGMTPLPPKRGRRRT